MKKFFSTNYTEGSFNIAMLLLRAALGLLMCLNFGIPKLSKFTELQRTFPNPLHIGHLPSLLLVIAAEVFGSILLVLGLFTRFAALMLVIELAVAVLIVHRGQPVKDFQIAILFLTGYFVILLVGPGKYSVDRAMGK